MIDTTQIKPDMQLLGSDNLAFGKVDHLEGASTIKIAKDETGQHHYIPVSWVTSVDSNGLHVDRSKGDVVKAWSLNA